MSESVTLPGSAELLDLARQALARCGVDVDAHVGELRTRSPINGEALAGVRSVDAAGVHAAVDRANAAFREWRTVPGPARGALVKRFGELLSEHKDDIATLISLEVGKITSEARGE